MASSVAPTPSTTERTMYPVETLIELQRTLPLLMCDLKRFSAESWRAQILIPPGEEHTLQTWFPADFPPFTTRRFSEIPDHRIPASAVDKSPGNIVGMKDDVGSKAAAKRKQREESTFSFYSGDTSSTAPLHRQPLPPPKGILSQQDAGFARFLKDVASPTHKRVTAGGRIVSAENPPRLYGRRKQGSDQSWARVNYSHVQTDLPQNANEQTTFLSFPQGSFCWGPNGELYVRPAPEMVYQSLYPGQQAVQMTFPPSEMTPYQIATPSMPGVTFEGGLQTSGPMGPPNLNYGVTQMPGQQLPMMATPMTLNNLLQFPAQITAEGTMAAISAASGYESPYQWMINPHDVRQLVEDVGNEHTRKIRTPRVNFPIGSRFDYEQNQQALGDRLDQLASELDDNSYMSLEDAELKRLEKNILEEQIEQFRQVWELQTYLAGDGGQESPPLEPSKIAPTAGTHARPCKSKRRGQNTGSMSSTVSMRVPGSRTPLIVRSTTANTKTVDYKVAGDREDSADRRGLEIRTILAAESKLADKQVVHCVAPVLSKENISTIGDSLSSQSKSDTSPTALGVPLPFRYRHKANTLPSNMFGQKSKPSIERLAPQILITRPETEQRESFDQSIACSEEQRATASQKRNPVTPLKESGLARNNLIEEMQIPSLGRSGAVKVFGDSRETEPCSNQSSHTKSGSSILRQATQVGTQSTKSSRTGTDSQDREQADGNSLPTLEATPTKIQGKKAHLKTALTILSDNMITPVNEARYDNGSGCDLKKRASQKERGLRPASAIESLRKLFQQHGPVFRGKPQENRAKKKVLPDKMEGPNSRGPFKGKGKGQKTEQIAKQQEIQGIISDPASQQIFLDQTLQDPRYAHTAVDPDLSKRMVGDEAKNLKLREQKHPASRGESEEATENRKHRDISPRKIAMPHQLEWKAQPSPALPTVATAQGVMQAHRQDGEVARKTAEAPRPISAAQQAHQEEVNRFFSKLKREEGAKIARYKPDRGRK